jgi:hypothetical protein
MPIGVRESSPFDFQFILENLTRLGSANDSHNNLGMQQILIIQGSLQVGNNLTHVVHT